MDFRSTVQSGIGAPASTRSMYDGCSKARLHQRTPQDTLFFSLHKNFSNRFIFATPVFQYISILTFNPTLSFLQLYLCVVRARECLHRLMQRADHGAAEFQKLCPNTAKPDSINGGSLPA